MDFTTLQDARLLAWASERLGVTFQPDQCRWVAGLEAGGAVWVVVYSRFSRRGCELTIATDGSKRWASKRSLRLIFGMPFKFWGLRRTTFVVSADNKRSIDMLERLGAVREGTVRKAFDGDVDGHVYGMLREECRWVS